MYVLTGKDIYRVSDADSDLKAANVMYQRRDLLLGYTTFTTPTVSHLFVCVCLLSCLLTRALSLIDMRNVGPRAQGGNFIV